MPSEKLLFTVSVLNGRKEKNFMARITDYGVTPNDQVMVEGTLSYSRLARKVEGEELKRENERRAKNGIISAISPFWSVSLDDPVIIYKSDDPNTPSKMENYWSKEKIYNKKSGGTATTAEKKGSVAPRVLQLKPDGTAREINLQSELAAGSKVRIIVESFQGQMGLGYGFTTVLVMDDPVRFYEGNSMARALAAYNINIVDEAPTTVSVENPEVPSTPEQPTAAPAPQPAPQPTPQPTPQPAPQGTAPQNPGATEQMYNPFHDVNNPWGNPNNAG